jgi:formylglycine-generating enzyme required for sulfatase activity
VLGNVWQWTDDCWHANYDVAPEDGRANTVGDCNWRVMRGGSWFSVTKYVRSAYRERYLADDRAVYLGFRVARTLP